MLVSRIPRVPLIKEQSDEVARLLQMFQRAAVEGFDSEGRLNIESEARLLVEIEDIHDELIILRMVLKDQESVTDQLSKLLDPLGYDRNQQPRFYARHLSVKDNRLLKSHLQRIDNMEKMTQKAAKTVCSLRCSMHFSKIFGSDNDMLS
jgi:hypothetical protein